MPSALALTIALFGISCLVAGIHTIISPPTFIANFSLPPDALPTVYGNGLAAIAMGLYYILAAYQENWMFFIATIPMRLLTATVFASLGGPWMLPAVWEGVGALASLAAAVWESSKKREKMA